MNWKTVQIERENSKGDYDISSPQAAVTVPAWPAGGLTVPHAGMKPSRMMETAKHLDPLCSVYFGPRQTQEQEIVCFCIASLAEWPTVLTGPGMTAGVAPRHCAAGSTRLGNGVHANA